MSRPAPGVGATLFVRPEDTAQDVSEGFYARVVSVLNGQVLFEAIEVGDEVGNESIPATVAARRQVPDDEVSGSRVSTWLRQGVAFFDGDAVHFGQVTDTSELGIQIFSSFGLQWKTRVDVVCVVNSLYAMLLFDLAVPPSTWTAAFIQESMARLEKFVAGAAKCPGVDDAMNAIAGLDEHSPDGVLREWREARTGQVHLTSTTHALLYTYYGGGGHDLPDAVRRIVGNSIADDPAHRATFQAARDVRPKTKRPRLQSAYLASETSFDGQEDVTNSEPRPYSFVDALAAVTTQPSLQPAQPQARAHARGHDSTAPRPRGRSTAPGLQPALDPTATAVYGPQVQSSSEARVVTPLQAAAVLRARLADNHELLNLFRLATSGSTDDDDGSNRGKGIHKPSSATRRIHYFVTAPSFQGTSAHSFVLHVAASSVLQCYPYPSIIVLLYHLAFGRPGLSIMHLCSITLLECMALQETNPVNMMDYGSHVTVPVARKPKSWVDVHDAVNGLVLYCNTFTNSTTALLAASIARFVTAMQAQGHWPESHLPALVYWINGRLEAYRSLVDQYVNTGVGEPGDALAWFTPSNPDLVPLQNTMIRSEINALQGSRQALAGQRGAQQQQTRQGSTTAPAAPAWSAMPTDVAAAIPTRQNQELCLRFASRKGCRVTGATCGFGARTRGHFVDKSLPRNIRAYIISKYGGLAAGYADGN